MEVIKKYLAHQLSFPRSSAVILLALLLFGIFIPFEFADAGWWSPLTWVADEVLGLIAMIVLGMPYIIFLFILQLILTLSSFLVFFAGYLLLFFINLDIPFTHCTPEVMAVANDCFVQTAWLVMRDITNMLLIVALVVVAFATILRVEGYGWKKALLPLILVALLVNFSKVIVGIVVDISTVIMGVFLEQITGLEILTSSLANQGKLISNYLFSFNFLTLSGNIAFILKTIILIAFQMFFAFLMALFAFLFVARLAALWILTIASPIAFAAAIFPATKRFFQTWRSQLISWALLGVTAGFALWLCKLFASKLETFKGPIEVTETILAPSFLESNPLESFILQILPYALHLIVCSALFLAALRTNAMGANVIIKQGERLRTGVRGAATRWTKKKAVETYGGRAQKALGRAAGSGAARVPLLGGGIRAFSKFAEQKIRAEQRLQDSVKEAENLSEAVRMANLKTESNAVMVKALLETQLREDPKEIQKLLEGPNGKDFEKTLKATVSNLSLRFIEKSIINQLPQFAYASRAVQEPTEIRATDNEAVKEIRKRYEAYRKGERGENALSYEEAKNAIFVQSRTRDKKALFQDVSLGDKGVLAGIEMHKDWQPFEDFATADERMNYMVKAYIKKHGGDRVKAFEDIGDRLKERNFRYAEDLLRIEEDATGKVTYVENPELYDALAKKVHKFSRGFVNALAEHSEKQGEAALNHLLRKVHDNPALHEQFEKKLFKDDLIKARMRPDLIGKHETGKCPGAPSAGSPPPPATTPPTGGASPAPAPAAAPPATPATTTPLTGAASPAPAPAAAPPATPQQSSATIRQNIPPAERSPKEDIILRLHQLSNLKDRLIMDRQELMTKPDTTANRARIESITSRLRQLQSDVDKLTNDLRVL